MSQLVKIKTFRSEIEAEVAATVLREEGIEPYIHSDDAGGFEPQLQITRGVDLLVEEEDSERALDLLAANASPQRD